MLHLPFFSDRPWEGVYHRYSFIPTSAVVESLLAQGWTVAAARQQRVLLQDRKEFTRHILRLRRDDSLALHVGDVFPEVVLVNSHDRGSAYQMHAGLYRLVCSNGLVVDDGTFACLSIRHTGNALDDVRRGANNIVQEVRRILGEVRGMQVIALTQQERAAFAGAALSLRFDEPDLWTPFNVVQENLVRGGLRYVVPTHRNEEGIYMPSRRARPREVKSILEDTKLNKALWTLAEELKRLKTN